MVEVSHKTKGKTTIFEVKGRLDSNTSPEVETKILESINQGSHHIILNFSNLDYISSAGIRVLVHCHKELEKKKGKIYLAAIPKPIENVLYITGFLPYFQVYENEVQAISAINQLKD